jgi:hypothetical protein
MGSRPNSYKQTDVARAIRAARAAGIANAVIEIDPRSGRITIRSEPTTQPSSPPPNPWNEVLTDHAEDKERAS